MDPALRLLMRMQAKAVLRRTLRGAKTPKGALFAVVGGLMLLLWFGSAFSAQLLPRTNQHLVRLWAPVILLAFCALTLLGGTGDRVISFTPGEINFLFPGPFTRRSILLFKLARTFIGALLSGTIMSMVLLRHASNWHSAWVASFLAMLFVQFLTLNIVLLAQAVGEHAYSKGRKIALGIVLAIIVIALAPAAKEISANSGAGIAEALHRSPVSRIALSPMAPFAQAFTAESALQLALWGSVAAAIDLALFWLVFRLDADYREVSLAASQRYQDRVQRMRRGQMPHLAARRTGKDRRSHLGMFPWLGGAGPIAWRQLTATLRASRGILIAITLMCVGMLPMFFSAKAALPSILAVGIWGTMYLTIILKFDFRAEIDQMEWTKALPIGPTATAAGQIIVPVVILSLVQLLLLGTAAFVAKGTERLAILIALPMTLPFNLLLIGIENLMFLLFPSCAIGAAPGDLGVIGRQIVFFFVKTIVLLICGGTAGLLGFLTWFVTGKSIVAGATIAFIVLSTMSLGIVPLIGLAYKRFDPSRDMPA